jgi:hypothetical protein
VLDGSSSWSSVGQDDNTTLFEHLNVVDDVTQLMLSVPFTRGISTRASPRFGLEKIRRWPEDSLQQD